jgi:beta-glucuronidase
MKRIAFLISLICVFAASAAAQVKSPTLIGNMPGRTLISLNGQWRAIVDPYESGLSTRTGLFENRKPKDKADFVEYDFDASTNLAVPGDWNSQRDDLLFYEGPVWYKKSFAYQKRAHTRVFLYFGAANYHARVYLNAVKLGEHEGGFTPFNFEITDAVKDGDNFVVVEVNSARRADAVPSIKTDWWNYGGLTRNVQLVEVPDTFIQYYSVQLAKGSATEIRGWVQLNGSVASQQGTIEIPEAHIKQTFTTDATGRAEFHFPVMVQLWTPENPKLYRVTLSAAGDSISDDIGFRTIETRGTQILLNRKPIFLRGINMHEEAPLRGGRANTEEDERILLTWAKDLGCNFVRFAHYPHNEFAVRLADRLGLMVWSEIPLWQDIAWDNPATLAIAQEQLRDMITRDRNRAAIILWSLSNETPITPARTQFLTHLAADARQLDDTRLITSALNRVDSPDPTTRQLSDPLCEALDVLGLNQYIGWYVGRPEDADITRWKFTYNKPVIASEFGAEAPAGFHGDPGARWTEEYQASVYEHQLKMLRQIPQLAGIAPWILMDFRSPRRLLAGVQDYHNRKGLISDRGQRKKAFYILQKFYKEMAQPTN